MGVLLEIKAGPFAGKKVAVVTGQTVTFGRAEGRAQFALPDDTFMSGVHFAVECGPSGCRVQDRKSSNGTFLNGARIKDAMLANGDEIKGGQTVFMVKIVADAKLASLLPVQEVVMPSVVQQRAPAAEQSHPAGKPTPPAISPSIQPGEEPSAAPAKVVPQPPSPRRIPAAEPPMPAPPCPSVARPDAPAPAAPGGLQKSGERAAARGAGSSRSAAFSVMGWSFPAAPAEWQVQEGFGLQQYGHGEFPNSVAASEELLGGITLQQFVESQISMLRGYLRDPKIEPTVPPRIAGAEESLAVDVRHSTKDGKELVYRRIYSRSGLSVGVLTVTTLAADLPQVLQSLQPLLDGAAFQSTLKN
ncbi:MAG: FHA domain-containing protein [Candidatus Acidiferrum sp.]